MFECGGSKPTAEVQPRSAGIPKSKQKRWYSSKKSVWRGPQQRFRINAIGKESDWFEKIY